MSTALMFLKENRKKIFHVSGIGSLSLGVKHQEREPEQSPPTITDVKKMRICISTSRYSFMA
jgi:hypothetical protein